MDYHHTVEDVGIALGEAFREALGDKRAFSGTGSFLLPMDEALVLTAVDLSGRAVCCCDLSLPAQKVGDFDTELVEEFFPGFTRSLGAALHVRQLAGKNTHHIIRRPSRASAGPWRRRRRWIRGARIRCPAPRACCEGGLCMIAIIDYGVGNLFSLTSSLCSLGLEAEVTGERARLEAADRIILPGVGAFGDAAEKLRSAGLAEAVRNRLAGENRCWASAWACSCCLNGALSTESTRDWG